MSESVYKTTKLGDWTIHVYPEPDGFVDIQFPSSNGQDIYSVLWNRNGISCECKSFEYRKTCRHVLEIKKFMMERNGRTNSSV